MLSMRRFLLTCLLFLISSLVFAQQTPEEQLAIQYYKDGEYEKASELFDKIQLTKKNAYIYYYKPSDYSSNYADLDADNCFVMDKVAQFAFGANIENTTYGFGVIYMYLSLPGGPDLNALLQ